MHPRPGDATISARPDVPASVQTADGVSGTIDVVQLADIAVPDTAAARAALKVVAAFSPPALVNHVRRSYLFAAGLAKVRGLRIDHETLFVASVLHDLGLEAPFDSHSWPFEQAGGAIGQVFAIAAGWPSARAGRVSAIIVAHMQGADPATDPEGHLLDLATGLDIAGRGQDELPADFVREVVGAHPRLDLVACFGQRFAEQARRKPQSTAARAVAGGLAERLRTNPLDRL